MLKELCLLNGASGDESAVREYIIDKISDFCEYETDALGSVIAFKKGKKRPNKKVCFNAHMDEVGFIITDITEEGYLKFAAVGGIDRRVCIDRVVKINNIKGVIGDKALHQLKPEEEKVSPALDKLLIDIGASSKEEAEKYVCPGDYAYFESEYYEFGDGYIKAKALDDRIGCMLLIKLIQSELEYDTWFCFNTQEEVGLRGAKCTAFQVQSDISVILEATTASDLDGVSGGNRVCFTGGGPVISFMDRRTIYDRELFKLAFETARENSIPCQTKTAVAGGNDAGAIQTSGKGAKVCAISLPCRYIHCAASVVKKEDIENTEKLIFKLTEKLYD